MSERPAASPPPDPGSGSGSGSAGPGVRPPLAERALSEAYSRLRYRDVSLLIWQQQQQQQEAPPTFLSRSQSAWYSNYGNQAVLIRDTRGMRDPGGSKICSIM